MEYQQILDYLKENWFLIVFILLVVVLIIRNIVIKRRGKKNLVEAEKIKEQLSIERTKRDYRNITDKQRLFDMISMIDGEIKNKENLYLNTKNNYEKSLEMEKRIRNHLAILNHQKKIYEEQIVRLG